MILLFGAVAEILLSVVAPLWYKRFVDAVIHVQTLADARFVLFSILFTAVGIRAMGMIAENIRQRLQIRFQPRIMHALHEEAMQRTLAQSSRFFTDQFAGSLTRKLGRIAGIFEQLTDTMFLDVWGIILSLGSILFILYTRYTLLAVIVSIWIIAVIAIKTIYILSRLKYFAEFSRLDAVAIGVMADVFGNALTVKSFAKSVEEVDRFLDADKQAMDQMRQNWLSNANVNILNLSCNILLEIGVLSFLIVWFLRGEVTIGDVVLIQSFLLVIFGKVANVGRLVRRVLELTTQAKEILDIIWAPVEVTDRKKAKPLHVSRGKIEFRGVDFSYHEKKILQGLQLTIGAKEKIAFVGPSGAGKSTLTKLLLRFYDIERGAIFIDGQEIAQVTQDSLRQQISLVPQEPLLFHRSLLENIGYGVENASEKKIIEAAKKAHCHEFISHLPNGYETMVGERGVKLSGGERQRVAIARAILKNAPILVLDEATSSLDSESESLIQDALHTLMKNKTVIVIAHRLSTIMEMDRIIVMEQGKVVDEGTHNELLQKVGIYQKLWNIQAGGFVGSD